MKHDTHRGGIFMILEILIVLAIVAFIFMKIGRIYFGSPVADEEVNAQLTAQGIDTSNAKSVIDSTKSKVQAINQQAIEHQREMERLTR
jgi:hypothetical protein